MHFYKKIIFLKFIYFPLVNKNKAKCMGFFDFCINCKFFNKLYFRSNPLCNKKTNASDVNIIKSHLYDNIYDKYDISDSLWKLCCWKN